MLITFSTRNYKSFKDEITFSMAAAPKQKGLDYSVFESSVSRKKHRVLSSAVIYGPNASGKTNLIGAMDTMREIVLRGHIKNVNENSFNQAANTLELIPFKGQKNIPTLFSIKFIENGLLIEYSFEIQLGSFLNRKFERFIESEILKINDNIVFERRSDLFVNINPIKNKYLNSRITQNIESARDIAFSSLNEKELFLTNGFKAIFAKELVSLILNWFQTKLTVVYRSDSIKMLREYSDLESKKFYVEKTLTDVAKEFGIHSNALGYIASQENETTVLSSIIKEDDLKAVLPAEMYESYGTVRFVNEFPLIIDALLNGGVLVMDEFDASIHPMALMNIINIFHNDDINIHHAQLIFNTHNPIFLNANLFRRDEIKFVERDDQTHSSDHYSLSDFKTFGERGVRKGEDYMKNYFVNQYGAIKDVDFSSILESIIKGAEENED